MSANENESTNASTSTSATMNESTSANENPSEIERELDTSNEGEIKRSFLFGLAFCMILLGLGILLVTVFGTTNDSVWVTATLGLLSSLVFLCGVIQLCIVLFSKSNQTSDQTKQTINLF